MVSAGHVSERLKKPTLVISVSLAVLLITSAMIVPVNSMVIVIAIIFINAIFIQAYFGPLFTLAVEIVGDEKTGISNGVSNMFAVFGGLFSAFLMGVLRDTTGSFEWGFYTICMLSATGLVLTFVLEKVRKKKAVSQLE